MDVHKWIEWEVSKDESTYEWRVEVIDIKTGDCFVTIFSGPLAESRALEYADFKNGTREHKE